MLAFGGWGILTPALLVVAAATMIGGHGAQASARAAHAVRERARTLHGDAARVAAGSAAYDANPPVACLPVGRSSGYVNPLAGAKVTRERIDQGVDYAGSGTLTAIGPAKLTYVGMSGTGWPGAFLEYRLLSGPDAGCFVYYAEGINPAAALRPGMTVRAGQAIASIIRWWPSGVELGWGAGISTKTIAAKTGKWSATDDEDSIASAAGKSFSALIARLGGPPGKVEG